MRLGKAVKNGAVASVAILLAGAWAAAQEPKRPLEEIRERLAAERMALSALREERVGLLETLDFFQRRSHESSKTAARLQQQLLVLRAQSAALQRQEEAAREAFGAAISRLNPRLSAYYRLTRHPPLEMALSASSFHSLVWQVSALSSILRGDLEVLAGAKRLAVFEQLSLDELSGLQNLLATVVEAARREEVSADAQRAVFREALAAVEREEKRSASFVSELERAELNLSRLVERLPARASASAFAVLKGRLPFPTRGMIEVGFGKVINPKFNTLTVQKGVDIRAPSGTPVSAVAAGTVVYADWLRGYGNLLIVDHGGGYHTLMAHLDSFSRSPGDEVHRGDELGRVGDSGSIKGAYLYFEVRFRGKPVDPAAWLSEPDR